MKKISKTVMLTALFAVLCFLFPKMISAQDLEPVTVHTFVRAESDVAIKKIYDLLGFNKWFHLRAPVAIDEQKVIRMNRETIYSSVVLDLSKPAYITLPETNGRYMSFQVVSQDHYSYATTRTGRHEVNQETVGTRYAYIIIRTFIDAEDPKDVAIANKLQDELMVEGGGDGPLDIPNWNIEQLLIARDALNTLAKLGGVKPAEGLGMKEDVNPIDHLLSAASGWGGLPEKYAYYVIASVNNTDGTPYEVTVKDVPVDAFWSITVYNADGFLEKNDMNAYSISSITAKPNEDGSFTLNFGSCEDGRLNCLPITKGWNYAIRMYEPRQEILDGTWKFPEIKEVK